jgi:hypothetical protein
MSELAPGWADAEKVVMALLAPIARTVTSTPNPLVAPLIRVQRVGGSDDGITDHPRVERRRGTSPSERGKSSWPARARSSMDN